MYSTLMSIKLDEEGWRLGDEIWEKGLGVGITKSVQCLPREEKISDDVFVE